MFFFKKWNICKQKRFAVSDFVNVLINGFIFLFVFFSVVVYVFQSYTVIYFIVFHLVGTTPPPPHTHDYENTTNKKAPYEQKGHKAENKHWNVTFLSTLEFFFLILLYINVVIEIEHE